MDCSECGHEIDDCNESQPVCPACGCPDAVDDYQSHIACEDFELLKKYPDYSPDLEVAFEDLPEYLDNSLKSTRAPMVAKRPYKNVCWYCHAPVASDNAATPQCPKCRWYQCGVCGSCKRGCSFSSK